MSERYRTIVADPPWPIADFPAWFDQDRRSVKERALGINPTPYATMSVADIAALPVAGLVAPGSSHLYLWTPSAYLWTARDVAMEWGFQTMYPLVWCKPPMGRGLGGTFASNTEFVLFCRHRDIQRVEGSWQSELRSRREDVGLSTKDVCAAIGAHGAVNHGGVLSNWESGLAWPTWEQWKKLKEVVPIGDSFDGEIQEGRPRLDKPFVDTRWFQWPRGQHSAKPEAFLDIVEQVSPAPRLEMFSRRARLGWDTWGDEALHGMEATA